MTQVDKGCDRDGYIHLVVVELHYHAELIKTLYELLSQEKFRISLVTLPGIFKKTGLPEKNDDGLLNAYLKDPKETVSDFLGRVQAVFDSADLVYFNTIRHNWRELNNLNFDAVSMIRIHNVHCDFTHFSHFNRPALNFLGIVSHLIRKVLIGREWAYKKSLFGKIDYFMFPNKTITDYVLSNQWLDPEKILPPVLPFGYLGEKDYSSRKDKDEVVLAITGKVTNAKKDFDLVYKALSSCIDELRYPVRLILLGNAGQKHAKKILENFKSLESDKFTLDYSDGYVPADVFEKKVSDVDFILAPIQVDTHFRKYHEVYGKSKMSGIDNDILLYRKPSLVVSDYQMEEPLSRVVGYFDPVPDSLAQKLKEWVSERRFEGVEREFSEMDEYKRQVIASRFYEICQKIVQR